MTMGTASTMTALAETLGLCIPGASSIPAVDAAHSRIAGLDYIWDIELCLEAGKLFHIHLNSQDGQRYDQDQGPRLQGGPEDIAPHPGVRSQLQGR